MSEFAPYIVACLVGIAAYLAAVVRDMKEAAKIREDTREIARLHAAQVAKEVAEKEAAVKAKEVAEKTAKDILMQLKG